MTESSIDRTKRQFIKKLDEHEWSMQVSIFITSADELENALELFQATRSHLARKLPEQPFLWRLAVKRENPAKIFGDSYTGTERSIHAPYLTMFTTDASNAATIKKAFESLNVSSKLKIMVRTVTSGKVASYRSAVKNQDPHDLKKVFGDKHSRRFGILNLAPPQSDRDDSKG